jgi:hypothetical protein
MQDPLLFPAFSLHGNPSCKLLTYNKTGVGLSTLCTHVYVTRERCIIGRRNYQIDQEVAKRVGLKIEEL